MPQYQAPQFTRYFRILQFTKKIVVFNILPSSQVPSLLEHPLFEQLKTLTTVFLVTFNLKKYVSSSSWILCSSS